MSIVITILSEVFGNTVTNGKTLGVADGG